MLISKTPYRISFFGGGTDLPEWYRENGGSVLSTTIDKYCYLTCRPLLPFFNYKYRFVYSTTEAGNSMEDIEHPAIKGVLQALAVEEAIEVHHIGELPGFSGLGSSSSFTVGLLNVIMSFRGQAASKRDLGLKAIEIEQGILGETVGSQDQVAVAHGGLNRIDFNRDGSIEVAKIVVPLSNKTELQNQMLLVYTGIQRRASDIEKKKLDRFQENRKSLEKMSEFVDQAVDILAATTFDSPAFGAMLHESWLVKKSLSSQVSNDIVDHIYSTALANGAYGGKLLGAGGGGFMLFLAPPHCHEAIKSALSPLVFVDFCLEDQGASVTSLKFDMTA